MFSIFMYGFILMLGIYAAQRCIKFLENKYKDGQLSNEQLEGAIKAVQDELEKIGK